MRVEAHGVVGFFDVAAGDVQNPVRLAPSAFEDQDGVHGPGEAVGAGYEGLEVLRALFADVVNEQDGDAVVVGDLLEPGGRCVVCGVGARSVGVGPAHLLERVDDDQPGVWVGLQPFDDHGVTAVGHGGAGGFQGEQGRCPAAGGEHLPPSALQPPPGVLQRAVQDRTPLHLDRVRGGSALEHALQMVGRPTQRFDYDNWPLYRDLQNARGEDLVTAYCLGIGLDTLTLTATVLTVVVMDDDVFDYLFGESVEVNAEGVFITAVESSSVSEGVPFNEANVTRLLTQEPMASPGACILDRAWRFRDQILGK